MAETMKSRVRAITVAEQPVQANAMALLLGTCPAIDVVDVECYAERARTSILRHRPDVVVIRSIDDHLYPFSRLLDLRLAIPDLGFVVVPGDRTSRIAHLAGVDRAVVVLASQFSLEDLLSAVTLVAGRTSADHDREYMSVPIAM